MTRRRPSLTARVVRGLVLLTACDPPRGMFVGHETTAQIDAARRYIRLLAKWWEEREKEKDELADP